MPEIDSTTKTDAQLRTVGPLNPPVHDELDMYPISEAALRIWRRASFRGHVA